MMGEEVDQRAVMGLVGTVEDTVHTECGFSILLRSGHFSHYICWLVIVGTEEVTDIKIHFS
jgi:hypothetical protein